MLGGICQCLRGASLRKQTDELEKDTSAMCLGTNALQWILTGAIHTCAFSRHDPGDDGSCIWHNGISDQGWGQSAGVCRSRGHRPAAQPGTADGGTAAAHNESQCQHSHLDPWLKSYFHAT